MKLNSNKLNIKQIVKQIVFSISASLLLTSNVVAYEEAKNTLAIEAGSENRTELSLEREKPVIVAQLYNYCYGGESMFVAAETRGFWVNICGGDYPHTYVGVSKTDGSTIRLPLNDYSSDGSWYEARNGSYSYALIFGSAKGHFLSVTQGSKQLVRQPLTNWQ